MNMKAIIIVAIILVVATVAVLYQPSTQATVPSGTISDASVAAVSSVLGDQYSSLIQDQLNTMSADQPTFNAQTQDSIASDLSQFYY